MFLLHLTYPSGTVQTVSCASAFVRALWIISLTEHPVTLRCEDRVVAA
jgi:hypothetical protein